MRSSVAKAEIEMNDTPTLSAALVQGAMFPINKGLYLLNVGWEKAKARITKLRSRRD